MARTRAYPERRAQTLVQQLQPIITVAVLVTGIVIWAYQTFAQLSYVKEQNTALMLLIETRHKESNDHSDANRARMESLMADIRDSLKLIQQKIFLKR